MVDNSSLLIAVFDGTNGGTKSTIELARKKGLNIKNFDLNKYVKEHIYMTTGRIVSATIKLNSEKNISDLIDWFGHDVVISKKENEITATMRVNENALIYWALQYGEHVEILKPITSRNKIREMINKISNKYSE